MTKKFLVIDTETCNSIEQPLPYDIGYAICDRHGKIYAVRSFVVAEIFLDLAETMKSAYYAEKIPNYWEDIKSGNRKILPMWKIRKQIFEDMKNFKVKEVCAYNMGFDKRALNNLIRYTSKSWCRWFFPFGTKFTCIWSMACDAILARKSYIDFAVKNGLISNADNVLTSAEACYKYLTNDTDFCEEHTGLEDVKIEIEIMAYCYRQNKKLDKEINSSCWRKVQRKRKELDLRKAFK